MYYIYIQVNYKDLIARIVDSHLPNLIDTEIIYYDSHDNYTCKVGNFCIKVARHPKYNAIVRKQYELLPLISLSFNTPVFIEIGEMN